MLMKAFGSLDALYADLERVADLPLRGAATLGARLAAHRESVYLARQLTRIACDLSLGASASTLRRQLPDLPALGDLYDRLGFGPFLRRQAERLAQLPEVHATPSAA
jgi:DNA polymerase-1